MTVAGTFIQVVSQRAPRAVRSVAAGLALAGPAAVLGFLLARPEYDVPLPSATGYFYAVTFVSLLGVAVSAGIALGSGRLRDARAFFLIVGLFGVSGISLIHAVATPGVLVATPPWEGLAARLSLVAGSVAFLLSTVRWGQAGDARLSVLGRRVLIVLALSGLALAVPPRSALLGSASTGAPVMALLALAMFIVAGGRYLNEYRVSANPGHAALAAAMVYFAEAQVALWLSPAWTLSWWGSHVLILVGFLASVTGFGLTSARRRSPSGLVEALFLTETLNRLEASSAEAIVALIAAVEARDRYTDGHSARVSQMAVLTGEAMHLPGAALRGLERAGLIHDVGKLTVPDAILRKPGRLTPEEYEVVKQSPLRGNEVIGRMASLREELPGVLHHHEWYDGSGYPHGLRGGDIPLAARILAVADVYDALTSERSYRGALSEDEALAHLRQMAGTQFDPAVVEAFVRIEPAWRVRRRRTGV